MFDHPNTLREAVFDSHVSVEYLHTLSLVSKLIPIQGRERVKVKT